MSVKDIAKLRKLLAQFLAGFACCFARGEGRHLLGAYVRGLLSDVQRKNAEAIALHQHVAPRTLQRFLQSIVWDEQKLRDRCQRLVAKEHYHPEAIGCLDETGTAKSGKHTAGVKRQYNGNRGKVENCVNSVALAYSAPDSIACWTLGCTFLKSGQMIRSAEKKPHSRRGCVPDQTANRPGSD